MASLTLWNILTGGGDSGWVKGIREVVEGTKP